MAEEEKVTKPAYALEIGDMIMVAGSRMMVAKMEDIFHHAPATRVRLTLSVSPGEYAVLFLNQGQIVEIVE